MLGAVLLLPHMMWGRKLRKGKWVPEAKNQPMFDSAPLLFFLFIFYS